MTMRRLTYGLVDCASGALLVAATERGVCRVVPVNGERRAAEARLARDFPFAELVEDGERLHAWTDAVRRYVDDGAPLHIPYDGCPSRWRERVFDPLHSQHA